MTAKRAPASTRRRRTADEARTAILDEAERQLVASGPAGIRLQEIAAELGISHPTVLHHFGSREALVQAVVERVMGSIHAAILESLERTEAAEDSIETLLHRVSAVISERGHARVLYWLALTGLGPPDERGPFARVVEATQALRRRAREPGQRAPTVEDTRFTLALVTLALTSESVLGTKLFENLGLPTGEATHTRFRQWLASLIMGHLKSP